MFRHYIIFYQRSYPFSSSGDQLMNTDQQTNEYLKSALVIVLVLGAFLFGMRVGSKSSGSTYTPDDIKQIQTDAVHNYLKSH
jgi:hypothetical protein